MLVKTRESIQKLDSRNGNSQWLSVTEAWEYTPNLLRRCILREKKQTISITSYKDFSKWKDLSWLASLLDRKVEDLLFEMRTNGVPENYLPLTQNNKG